MTPDALCIEHLGVSYAAPDGERRVIADLSLRVGAGEAFGLIGESGCGKSTAAFAAVGHVAGNGRIDSGRILIDGVDLRALTPAALRRLRSRAVAMVYQDPARALNPSLRIERQMAEVVQNALGLDREAARRHAHEMLDRVLVTQPDRVLASYPHELSGGVQQRVVIAMALSAAPSLLILDEPTTALDATVEAEILDVVARLRADTSLALLLITHNLSAVERVCDRVGVMYAGALVEEGRVRDVLRDPRHPYTAGLLRCAPRAGRRKDAERLDTIPGFPPAPGSVTRGCLYAARCPVVQQRCRVEVPPFAGGNERAARCHFPDAVAAMIQSPQADRAPPTTPAATPMFTARGLAKTYRTGDGPLYALRGVDLDLAEGETLGIVGESGSGKSTLAKLIVGLIAPDLGGRVTLDGRALAGGVSYRAHDQRAAIQMIFQNPDLALNRAHRMVRLIGRALRPAAATRRDRDRRVSALATRVHLDLRHLGETPARLSGGMKQRVGVARAFAGAPRIVVCDEPTSALDVSVQSAILNLLVAMQRESGVSYLFISHDLAVVNYISDRVAVLYLGRLMEVGPTATVFASPQHPYTEALESSSLALHGGSRQRMRLAGDIPRQTSPPGGCVFHTRCPRFLGPICREREPDLLAAGPGHFIRCHIPADELRRLQARDAPDRDTAGPLPWG